MGEEKKEGTKEEKESLKDSKDGKKEEQSDQEIVLKVDMHCKACARKVARALKGFQGVENVAVDCKASKVVVKGKGADPIKVCERIQKKSGRKAAIISPLPNPSPGENQQENKEAKNEKKKEPPAVITVVLKVGMHCEACAQVLQKRIRKLQGVESVTTDLANDQVIVKGIVNPEKLVSDVHKKTGKQASIVKPEEKKEETKKEDEEAGEKKEGEEGGKVEDDRIIEMKKCDYWSQKYSMEYACPIQMFSDDNPNACSVM